LRHVRRHRAEPWHAHAGGAPSLRCVLTVGLGHMHAPRTRRWSAAQLWRTMQRRTRTRPPDQSPAVPARPMRLSRGPARAPPRLELPRGVRGPTRLVHFSPPIARGVCARATTRVSARDPWPLHGSNARLGHLLTPPAAEPGPLALAIPFGPHDLATALIYGETALATPGTRGKGTIQRW